jgi:hypothetical protein
MQDEKLTSDAKLRLLNYMDSKLMGLPTMIAIGFAYKWYSNPIWDTKIITVVAIGLIVFLTALMLLKNYQLYITISPLVIIGILVLLFYLLIYKGVYGLFADENWSGYLIALRIGIIMFGMYGIQVLNSTLTLRNELIKS